VSQVFCFLNPNTMFSADAALFILNIVKNEGLDLVLNLLSQLDTSMAFDAAVQM
jgi:hypothetical protein